VVEREFLVYSRLTRIIIIQAIFTRPDKLKRKKTELVLTGSVRFDEANGVVEQQEVHISSIVVHVRPDHMKQVKSIIPSLHGAEIYGESSDGKLVVVVETQKQAYISDVIEKIGHCDGVLSTALVYHQIELLDILNEQ
jgi:nitrate reductase NapD